MVKHIVCWNFQSALTDEEKETVRKTFKENTQHLKEVIPGVQSLSIRYLSEGELLHTSSREIMLEGCYDSEEALKKYGSHPEHLKLLDFIKANFCDRCCLDYTI